jgi:transcriptional regulator with XRE-family HTH domain
MNSKTHTRYSSKYRSMIASLTELRHKRGMSQYELAQKLGWNRIRLQQIEECSLKLDPLELHHVCQALGEDASAIYSDFVESLDK